MTEIFGLPVIVRPDMPRDVLFALVGNEDAVAAQNDGSIVRLLQTGPRDWHSVINVFRARR